MTSVWRQKKSGEVRQVKDEVLKTSALELKAKNVATTHITSPPPPHNCLGLRLPCVTLVLKYFNQPFSFEIQILDDEGMKRRFRFSTYHKESGPQLTTFVTRMRLNLVDGWNIVQLNLADFTQRAYRTMYMETLTVQVHANCRLRRIYFSDRLYEESELPKDYRVGGGGINVDEKVKAADKEVNRM